MDLIRDWAESRISPIATVFTHSASIEIRTEFGLVNEVEIDQEAISPEKAIQKTVPQKTFAQGKGNYGTVRAAWDRSAHSFTVTGLKEKTGKPGLKSEPIGRISTDEIKRISQYLIQELDSFLKKRERAKVAYVALDFMRGKDNRWYFLQFSQMSLRSHKPKTRHRYREPRFAPPCRLAEYVQSKNKMDESIEVLAVERVRELKQKMLKLVSREEQVLYEPMTPHPPKVPIEKSTRLLVPRTSPKFRRSTSLLLG